MSDKHELAEEISSRAVMLSTLKSFTNHAGWQVLVKIAEEQKLARLGEYAYVPLKSMDEVPAQEFAKGEISGISLVTVSIFAHMEALETELKVLQQQEERSNEAETNSNAVPGSRVDDVKFFGGDDEPASGNGS